MRNELINFLDSIRDYVAESGVNIAHDERESSEFVDIYLQNKAITLLKLVLLAKPNYKSKDGTIKIGMEIGGKFYAFADDL